MKELVEELGYKRGAIVNLLIDDEACELGLYQFSGEIMFLAWDGECLKTKNWAIGNTENNKVYLLVSSYIEYSFRYSASLNKDGGIEYSPTIRVLGCVIYEDKNDIDKIFTKKEKQYEYEQAKKTLDDLPD